LIEEAFNEDTLKNLVQKIELVLQLPDATIDVVLNECMKEGKH